MAHRGPEAAEILNRLLEISLLQRRFIEENRLEEAISCQGEREDLFPKLEGAGGSKNDPDLQKLAQALVESDSMLSAAVEKAMACIGSRLGQINSGKSAVKAYGKPY